MANEKIAAAREKLKNMKDAGTTLATQTPANQVQSEIPEEASSVSSSSEKIPNARKKLAQLQEEAKGKNEEPGTLSHGVAQRETGTAPVEPQPHAERRTEILWETLTQKNEPSKEYSLHSGLGKAVETGSIGLELAREIQHMHETITQNVLEMFCVIDSGLERILNGEAYTFNQETSSVEKVRTGTLSEQVGNTMRTASEFAKLVSPLPQIVSNLTVSLKDTENAFGAILLKQPVSPRSTPEVVNTAYTPPSPAGSVLVSARDTQAPKTPPLSDGGNESARALALAQEMISVATEVKDRVDTNILTIIHTLDVAASRATNGEAFSLSNSGIITPIEDGNIINQLETTIRVTHDLTEILKDLPVHIETLIREVRAAENRFVEVLAAHK